MTNKNKWLYALLILLAISVCFNIYFALKQNTKIWPPENSKYDESVTLPSENTNQYEYDQGIHPSD